MYCVLPLRNRLSKHIKRSTKNDARRGICFNKHKNQKQKIRLFVFFQNQKKNSNQKRIQKKHNQRKQSNHQKKSSPKKKKGWDEMTTTYFDKPTSVVEIYEQLVKLNPQNNRFADVLRHLKRKLNTREQTLLNTTFKSLPTFVFKNLSGVPDDWPDFLYRNVNVVSFHSGKDLIGLNRTQGICCDGFLRYKHQCKKQNKVLTRNCIATCWGPSRKSWENVRVHRERLQVRKAFKKQALQDDFVVR